MAGDSDVAATDRGAGVRFPPPLIFLGFLLLGPLIDRWLELPPWPMPWWIGAIVAALGLALVAAALGAFGRAGEDPRPWTANDSVIDTGLYARSRNPMYLGMAIVMLGLAIVLHSVMAILLVPVAATVIGSAVIAREEAYLEGKFGQAYRDYCGRVGRWF